MSAQMLEVSLLGIGTVLLLERDAWSMVKRLSGKQQMSTPPPPIKTLPPPSRTLPPLNRSSR